MNKSWRELLEDASHWHEQGELARAQTLYEKVLQVQPKQPDAWHQLGLLRMQLGQFEQGIEALERAVALRPQALVFRNNLANAFNQQGQFEQAKMHYQEILAKNPDYAQAYNNLGSLYFRQKNYLQAEESYLQAIRAEPNYLDAHYNLGLCLFKRRAFDEARQHFELVLQDTPEHFGAQNYLAHCYFQQGDFPAAKTAYEFLVIEFPRDITALHNLASVCILQQNYGQAEALLEKVFTLQIEDADALYNLGVIACIKQQANMARDYFTRVIKSAPHYVAAYHNLAWLAFREENNTEAKRIYEALTLIEPDDPVARHLLTALNQAQTPETASLSYVQQLFDAYAAYYEPALQTLNYQVPKKVHEYLSELAQPEKQWLILDLGCGTGLVGEVLAPYASHLMGVDISPEMLKMAKQKEIYSGLIQGDMREALHGFSHELDVICAADSLVYVGDLVDLFHSVAHALRPLGLFIFNTEVLVDQDKDYHLQITGRFAHNETYIARLLRDNHFDVIKQQALILREDAGKPIMGMLYLMRLIKN